MEIPNNSIIFHQNYGILLTFSEKKIALNTDFYGYSSFYFVCDYPRSYVAISICAEIILWNSTNNIQGIMQKALNSENIQKIKNDLMSYVYSVSKVPSRTLFFKYTEAKELLCKNPLETRKIINLKLFPTDSNDDLTKKV